MRLKRNKYRATRMGNFSSKLEAAVYEILLKRQELGDITELKCQVSVYLTDARILYKPDFSFIEASGEEVWAEAKGIELASWRIKKRLWAFYGPGKLEIYKGSHIRPILTEVLKPKRLSP